MPHPIHQTHAQWKILGHGEPGNPDVVTIGYPEDSEFCQRGEKLLIVLEESDTPDEDARIIAEAPNMLAQVKLVIFSMMSRKLVAGPSMTDDEYKSLYQDLLQTVQRVNGKTYN